jgi:hypothetical protein
MPYHAAYTAKRLWKFSTSLARSTPYAPSLRVRAELGVWLLPLIVPHAPQIVTPTRRFVKQGKLVKITSRFVKETLFYLFNDVLIYGYEVMGSYIFKGEISMGTTWVRDLPNTERTFIILA